MLLLRLERLKRPTLLDHLRRCALLHSLVLLLCPLLVNFVDLGDFGGGGAVAIIVFMAAAYAAMVDTLVLFITRRRFDRRGGGA